MIRYADDFVACFENRHEPHALEKGLKARLAKFGLEVATDKTKTLRFGSNGGPRNGRFDFLWFEFYLEPDRQGKPRVKRRTATKKWLGGMQRMREWIKTRGHQKLRLTMSTLKAKLQGTWNYYGLTSSQTRNSCQPQLATRAGEQAVRLIISEENFLRPLLTAPPEGLQPLDPGRRHRHGAAQIEA
jgi:hypothetical protein